MDLTILYRGPLSSCNYGCPYCPFALRQETPAELAADHTALNRLVDWAAGRTGDRLSIFFTPWGEALIRPWYHEAIARLTAMPHIARIAIQTNLSTRLDWINPCDGAKLGLWCSYHPGPAQRDRFLARCRELERMGIRYSVGIVGVREHFDEIEALRQLLPPHVYLWINAYKRVDDYYSADELTRLERIDPLFPINNRRHPSKGRPCRTGSSVISVDGDGTIRRCHFIRTPLGNLYEEGFERALLDRPCENNTCGCHIGYVHMPELGLYDVFRDGVLDRAIPGFRPHQVSTSGL